MLIDSSSNGRRERGSRRGLRNRQSSSDSSDSTVYNNRRSRQHRELKRRRMEESSVSSSSARPSETPDASSTEYENDDPPQTASTSIPTPPETQDPRINVLGKRLTMENPFGLPIEENIALRWREVLNNGLPKEEQLELLSKYRTPENCLEVNAPVLNSEVMVAIDSSRCH